MASTKDFSDGPAGDSIDNDYVTGTGQSAIKVQKDEAPVESGVNPDTEDSDEQLAADEEEAINKDNIIEERVRGASKKAGAYTEPGDEEGLPGPEDGTSSVA